MDNPTAAKVSSLLIRYFGLQHREPEFLQCEVLGTFRGILCADLGAIRCRGLRADGVVATLSRVAGLLVSTALALCASTLVQKLDHFDLGSLSHGHTPIVATEWTARGDTCVRAMLPCVNAGGSHQGLLF